MPIRKQMKQKPVNKSPKTEERKKTTEEKDELSISALRAQVSELNLSEESFPQIVEKIKLKKISLQTIQVLHHWIGGTPHIGLEQIQKYGAIIDTALKEMKSNKPTEKTRIQTAVMRNDVGIATLTHTRAGKLLQEISRNQNPQVKKNAVDELLKVLLKNQEQEQNRAAWFPTHAIVSMFTKHKPAFWITTPFDGQRRETLAMHEFIRYNAKTSAQLQTYSTLLKERVRFVEKKLTAMLTKLPRNVQNKFQPLQLAHTPFKNLTSFLLPKPADNAILYDIRSAFTAMRKSLPGFRNKKPIDVFTETHQVWLQMRSLLKEAQEKASSLS